MLDKMKDWRTFTAVMGAGILSWLGCYFNMFDPSIFESWMTVGILGIAGRSGVHVVAGAVKKYKKGGQ